MKILFVDFKRSPELRTAQSLALLGTANARLLILFDNDNQQKIKGMISWAERVVCMSRTSKCALEQLVKGSLVADHFEIVAGRATFDPGLIQEIVNAGFFLGEQLGGLMERGQQIFFQMDLDKSLMAKQA